jgi:uncharacterized membrane protein YfcA
VSGVDSALLVGGALVAGVVNTLAGGASALTVPLLVLTGLPGNLANGTNRIGILVQNFIAAWRFRAEGVSGFRASLPALVPTVLGSLIGAVAISRVADATFQRLFGIVMIVLLVPIVLGLTTRDQPAAPTRPAPSRAMTFLAFFGIGLWGGAFQAGVGIAILFALSYAGYDLVRGNSVKVVINSALTLVAVPVFLLQGQVAWGPALLLSVGFAIGSTLGVRLAISRGEAVIRPILILAVLGLAGRMLGFY